MCIQAQTTKPGHKAAPTNGGIIKLKKFQIGDAVVPAVPRLINIIKNRG